MKPDLERELLAALQDYRARGIPSGYHLDLDSERVRLAIEAQTRFVEAAQAFLNSRFSSSHPPHHHQILEVRQNLQTLLNEPASILEGAEEFLGLQRRLSALTLIKHPSPSPQKEAA